MAKNNKKMSLSKRIVSLTIFIDSLFLLIISTLFLFYTFLSININQSEIVANQTQAVVSSTLDFLDSVKNDAILLSENPDVIEYIKYVNQGNNPIILEDDPDYEIYYNYLTAVNSVVDHQSDDVYDLIFLATETNCLEATDGCAILNTGDVLYETWFINQRPWYIALGNLEEVFTEPYIDAYTNDYTFTYVKRISENDTDLGYIGIDISLESLGTLIQEIDQSIINEASEIIVFTNFNDSPTLVFYTEDVYNEYFMKTVDDFAEIDERLGYKNDGVSNIISSYDAEMVVNTRVNKTDYLITYNDLSDYDWQLVIMVDNTMPLPIEIIFVIVILVIGLIVFLIGLLLNSRIKKVLMPIHEIIDSLEEIKNGNYSVRVNLLENNEIKAIGDAINLMSEEIDRQVKLVYESFAFDDVTGLKNRSAASAEIDKFVLTGSRRTAIVLIHVDNLKNINVIKGQMIGDNLIKSIAKELQKILHQGENLYANGNDEFVYLMTDITSLEQVEHRISRILGYFKEPLVVKNIKTEVKFFIGVAIYPTDGNTLDDLIKKCDTALFKAKKAGTKKVIFYNDNIAREVNYQAQVSEQLSEAIKNKELYLKYQPLVDNKSNLYGFEALARWSSPALGEISPEVFIANAEENYMIIPIGTWVLEEACKMQVRMKEKFNQEFVVSVNVSSIQILQNDFVDIVKKILKQTDINPKYLTLELTESVFINSSVMLEDKIQALHELGITFSLDDFGTGYASLTYLRQIAFDNLKIDKSFIDGIFGTDKDHKIVGTIVNLVHNLDMKVIAEGVETKKQYEYLKQISTDVFQGYLISKPLKEDEAIVFVDQFHKIAKAKRVDVLASKNE